MLKISIGIALVLAIVAVIYFNNSNSTETVDYKTIKRYAPTAKKLPLKTNQKKSISKTNNKLFSSTIKSIVCKTADTSQYTVRVGLKLLYNDKELETEIKLKNKNIKKLIKFTFQDKVIAQINATKIRKELLKRINKFLTSGDISDIVFTDFDLVPKENR